jgi:glycosyltransferase involved in cell wall biosynthesis
MRSTMRIVGMMAAYNDADVIKQVVEHTLGQGIELVILDDGSYDGSFEMCSEFLGKGVLSAERRQSSRREWEQILQELYDKALAQSPDWVLRVDDDEFLESPYPNLSLKEAIELEAGKGYNLIQFNNFEFWPTEKDDSSVKDVRKRMKYYTFSDDLRYRCWNALPGVRIAHGGGLYPGFPAGTEARISPMKFVLRHYRIRSYDQGLRKVFRDRLPRYSLEDRRKDWLVHYDEVGLGRSYFVIDSRKLTLYNDDGKWNLTRTFDGYFGAFKPPSLSTEQAKSQFAYKSNPLQVERGQTVSGEIVFLHREIARMDKSVGYLTEELRKRELQIKELEGSYALRIARKVPYGASIRRIMSLIGRDMMQFRRALFGES